MSTDSLSEVTTNPFTMQHLLKENKMKELALKKATNLIELLNIELQVERNASQQNLKVLELELKSKHQCEMGKMQRKIEEMELQLKRRSQTSIECERTIRKAPLSRANSCKSAENIRRRVVSRKHTETLTFQQAESEPNPQIQVSLELYKQQISEFEIWKRGIMGQMDQLIKKQYEDLELLINRIDESSEQCRGLGTSKQTHRDSTYQICQIIRKQNTLINGLLSYSQELQNLCKSTSSQLYSLIFNKNYSFEQQEPLQIVQITQKIKDILSFSKHKAKKERQELQAENNQLKNIMQSLIKIVKAQGIYK